MMLCSSFYSAQWALQLKISGNVRDIKCNTQTEFKPKRRGTNDSTTRIIIYNQVTAENRKISVSNRNKTLDVQPIALIRY